MKSFLSLLRGIALVAAFAGATVDYPLSAKPLDDYVNERSHSNYWALTGQKRGDAVTVYVLAFKSQQWRDLGWYHYLTVAIPDTVEHDTGLLIVLGDHKDGTPKPTTDSIAAHIAVETRSIVAKVGQVPNQPYYFDDDPFWLRWTGRREDALMIKTWELFRDSGDPSQPLQVPMTKAVCAAMDTLQQFAQHHGHPLEKFVVTGKSKRGWATWLAAAVDDRVCAIAPMVIDCLNAHGSFPHHRDRHGYNAGALHDFIAGELYNWWDTPQFDSLTQIIDPYTYLDRLDMPKLIINSSGDDFFPPDATQFYLDDLPGVTHYRMIPNSSHSLRRTDYADTLKAFYRSVLGIGTMPQVHWTYDNGMITLTSQEAPAQVLVWRASNPKRADFRVSTIGRCWKATPVTPDAQGTYAATVTGGNGCHAFFVEVHFADGTKVTSQAIVTE